MHSPHVSEPSFWICKTIPTSVSIIFLHIWQLILLPTAEVIFLPLYLSVSFYFYPTEEWLIGLPFNELHVLQCSLRVAMWGLIQKQTYFKSVSCCKAMVISRSLKIWHFQILAPVRFCITRHITKIVVIALEIKSPYLSILSVVFPAQLQLISLHSYIIIVQAIWLPELRLCQHFHYKHLVSKAL